MATRRIFTKGFFALSAIDQAMVVDAEIREAESVGDNETAERIRKRATEHGIYEREEKC
jgi:hypothetical protein